MRRTCLAVFLFGLTIAPVAAQTTVTLSPLPVPTQTGDVVGISLQNALASPIPARLVTFGQAFVDGAVQPTSSLLWRNTVTGALTPVQLDPVALNADGSVRFAALTTTQPALAGNAVVHGMVALGSAGSKTVPVDLGALAPQLTVTLNVHSGPGGALQQTINLSNMLTNTLAAGGPYWLHGPLATQVRLNRPVSSSLRLTVDITGYADGSVTADVQFNNDMSMQPTGGKFVYDATVTLNGVTQSFSNITQYQYQDWHTVLATNGPSALNVQHDPGYLISTGAVLPYGYQNGVYASLLENYAALAASTGFGAPLSTNGVLQYMPQTGGRPDIGYTTQYNTVWLMTQSPIAAKVALAQGDAGGAVPWNLMLPNGHWLSPADYPLIWTDGRGGPGSYTTGLTQQIDQNDTGWTPDLAHEPNLAYVPFLMTASRWYLDRLNAQAAFSLTNDWTYARCGVPTCDIVLNLTDSQRQQAWSMREVQEAAWIGKTGTAQAGIMQRAADHNWKYLRSQIPTMMQQQGQTTGWLMLKGQGQQKQWMIDYFMGVLVMSVKMGNPDASAVLSWTRNWLVGRFTAPTFNPHDGCAYVLQFGDPNTAVFYRSWSAIESASVAAGLSNLNGWDQSNGDYCELARASLAGYLSVYPTDAGVQQAFQYINTVGAPYIAMNAFLSDPTFALYPVSQ